MTPRLPVPSQVQERARNVANMLSSVASTLQGFTTADGAISAEIKLKRARDEIISLQAAVKEIKRESKIVEKSRIRDRAIIERDAVELSV